MPRACASSAPSPRPILGRGGTQKGRCREPTGRKRQLHLLFGPKSEKLTAEQESELAEVAGDLQEQVARSETDSEEVLDQDVGKEPKQDPKPRRRGRRALPVDLEVITTVLEPADAVCAQCGKLGDKIGEELSEQVDLIPAKLVVRRTVRIKRACRCGCGGVAIAPLPAALIPGSRLGLGLAVFILLSKYDDHRSSGPLHAGAAVPRTLRREYPSAGKRRLRRSGRR